MYFMFLFEKVKMDVYRTGIRLILEDCQLLFKRDIDSDWSSILKVIIRREVMISQWIMN